ncbi:glutathione S-transferase [Daldinia bambusicola]|nr:glutathione S-transferase [Daldinia bambusicola]
MSSLKPLILWGNTAPNPVKVQIILEELKIPYENKNIEFSEVKKEPFISVNPNGRVPAIEDPNTGVTLWESGAIIEYLIDTYDKEHKLSYGTSPEKYLIQQWIAFQISGQGPYYGQAVWFYSLHPEKVQSAIDRYVKEIERVRSVLEKHLSTSASGWLVGDKVTVADLAWVIWEHMAIVLLKVLGINLEGKYPHYEAWYKKLAERPVVQKAIAIRMQQLAKVGAVKAEDAAKKE